MPLAEPADIIREVELDGRHLTLEEVVAVARYRARVRLSDAARREVELSRAVVDRLIQEKAKVYGLTTGFGSKRDILIDPEELEVLQTNLVQSHAAGVGEPLAEDEVRAAMLLRANTLARGNSGVRPRVIEAVIDFLNHDVFPWVPSRGSLGASGDLAPLSHLALALIGDPHARFYRRGEDEPAAEGPVSERGRAPDYVFQPVEWRFEPAPPGLFGDDGLRPLSLKAKEGLALNNGTQVSAAIGMLTVYDASVLLESAELVCALSLEATKGNRDAFDPRLHEVRPVDGQAEVARDIRAFTRESENLTLPINTARLHRARRALAGAAEILTGSQSARDGLAEAVEQAGAQVDAFAEQAPRVADEPALAAEVSAGASTRAARQRVYRKALAPLRAQVLELYARVLTADLTGDGVKGRDFLADAVSQLQLALPEVPSVQDDYSFRCTPQVLGVTHKLLADTRRTLESEANSATDNPLIFPPHAQNYSGLARDYADTLTLEECQNAVVSGGNFHGQPVAVALDALAITLAELGNISERRTAHLVDGNLSNGLPSLLVWKSGLNNGLMIPQYVAASLVSENKVLSHPASVDSIPTCENTEDHVSMSALAALKCRSILRNAETVVAIELFTAWQGMSFRRPLRCGVGTETLWNDMAAAGMTEVQTDRVLYPDIEWSRRYLRQGKVWAVARAVRETVLD